MVLRKKGMCVCLCHAYACCVCVGVDVVLWIHNLCQRYGCFASTSTTFVYGFTRDSVACVTFITYPHLINTTLKLESKWSASTALLRPESRGRRSTCEPATSRSSLLLRLNRFPIFRQGNITLSSSHFYSCCFVSISLRCFRSQASQKSIPWCCNWQQHNSADCKSVGRCDSVAVIIFRIAKDFSEGEAGRSKSRRNWKVVLASAALFE